MRMNLSLEVAHQEMESQKDNVFMMVHGKISLTHAPDLSLLLLIKKKKKKSMNESQKILILFIYCFNFGLNIFFFFTS